MAGAQGSTMPSAAAETEMDIEHSRGGWGPSFEFAFDSEHFSDKVLRIEIVGSGEVAGGSLPEPASHRKEKGDAEQSIDSSSIMVGTPVLRVKTIHINSAILAVRSPFFLKLFSNGMKESDQTHPKLRIADSEENALMEILSFMYSGKLTTTEPTLLLNILMAADKYEVLSCVSYCSQLLTRLPMTTGTALLYLEHSCSISAPVEVDNLIVAAKEFLVNKYKDVLEFTGELKNFPIAGIEAIFSSTGLHVRIEDNIYVFILSWAHARYPELEERRKILSSRLLPLVRFSHMSRNGLQKVLLSTDDDIDHDQVNKCISELLLHKAYPSHLYGDCAVDAATWQLEERDYLCKPVRLVAFDGPCPQVIAYWDLKREECSRFFYSKQNRDTEVFSHPLRHAGLNLFLVAQCVRNQVSGLYSFGLFLYVSESSTRVTLQYEFAARTKASGKFVSRFEGKGFFTKGSKLGCNDVFGTAWSNFIADDNLFIDGMLHLRVDWTVVEQLEL